MNPMRKLPSDNLADGNNLWKQWIGLSVTIEEMCAILVTGWHIK